LAIPVLRYSFGIINWHPGDVQKVDRKSRRMPTTHGQYHTGTDTDHLYVPRKEGGRVMMQIEGSYIAEVMELVECLESKGFPLM
jgi:hypothetical protein